MAERQTADHRPGRDDATPEWDDVSADPPQAHLFGGLRPPGRQADRPGTGRRSGLRVAVGARRTGRTAGLGATRSATGQTRTSLSTVLLGLVPRRRAGLRAVDRPPRERWTWIGIDVAALLILAALVALTFHPTYATGWVWVSCLGGAVLGIAVGLVGALRNLPAWIVAAVLAAGYLLGGTFLAVPGLGIGMVVPTPASLQRLVFGVVTSWKQMLTISAPIGQTGGLLVVPLLTLLVSGCLGVSIALRTERSTLAWLPSGVAVVAGIVLGVQTPFWPAVVALGFLVVVLVWTAYRRDFLKQTLLGHQRRHAWQPAAAGLAVLALAAGCATVAQPYVAPQTYRHVARDAVVPPILIEQWPSPLQSFRRNVTDDKTKVLLTLTGMPSDGRIRIATLDAYDGVTMNVSNTTAYGADSGTFTRIGTAVPDRTKGEAVQVGVTVDAYSGVWVPTIGQLHSLTMTGPNRVSLSDNLFYNQKSGTAVDPTGLAAGETYRLSAVVPDQPSQADIRAARPSDLDLPPARPLPDQLTDAAARLTSAATGPGDAVIRIENALKQGYYSNGQDNQAASLSGHSLSRLQQLFTEQYLIGDEEQYAVAMALMVRSLGMASRVVYGYRATSAGTVQITGNDVDVWVEVAFDGYGWVGFDPTPPRTRALQEDTKQQPSKPKPRVDNPPPPPVQPQDPPPDNAPPQSPQQQDKNQLQIPWALLARVGLGVGIPLVVVGGPLLVIGLLKRRRRRLRLRTVDAGSRLAAGWAELVDASRDLGARVSARATRSETAAALAEQFPRAGAALQTAAAGLPPPAATLAARADASVFSDRPPHPDQVHAYWMDAEAARRALHGAAGRWRRLGAPFSIASLRRLR